MKNFIETSVIVCSLYNFGGRPCVDRDIGILSRVLQLCECEIGHFFHILSHISGKTDWIFMKILSQINLW